MDDVTLEINGQIFGGWEALTITRAIDNVASAFSFSGPFNPDNPDLRNAFRPFVYQCARVKIDGELLLTGKIEKTAFSSGAGDRIANIQGRSLTGAITDCAVDIGRYQFDGLSLSTIAIGVCNPHKIGVLAINDTNPIQEARAEPGETGFSFINKLAQDVSLILSDNERGNLVIQKITGKCAPVASIVENVGMVLSVDTDYDGTKRFSTYKALQQQDGAENIKATATDAAIKEYRPTIATGIEGDASDIQKAANWRRALALADSVSITVKVSGWRNNGGLIWRPGQIITLLAPGAFIMTEKPFLIAGVTLTLDSGSGRTADLRLVIPAMYSGDNWGDEPWAE